MAESLTKAAGRIPAKRFLEFGRPALDDARRKVSHYFKKVHRLYIGDLIDEETLRLILDKGQVTLWRERVEPLDWLMSPSHYGYEQFRDLGEMFDVPKRDLDLLGWKKP